MRIGVLEKKDMDWISVKDKLPSNSKGVVVFIKPFDDFHEYVSTGWYGEGEVDWRVLGFEGEMKNAVTHWAKFPYNLVTENQ